MSKKIKKVDFLVESVENVQRFDFWSKISKESIFGRKCRKISKKLNFGQKYQKSRFLVENVEKFQKS